MDHSLVGSDRTKFKGRTTSASYFPASLFCTFYLQLHTIGFYISTILNVGFLFLDNESSLVKTVYLQPVSNAWDFRLQNTWISDGCSDDFRTLPKMSEHFRTLTKMSKDFRRLRKIAHEFLKKTPATVQTQSYNLIYYLFFPSFIYLFIYLFIFIYLIIYLSIYLMTLSGQCMLVPLFTTS